MDSIEKASEELSDLTEGDECKSLPTLTFFYTNPNPFSKVSFFFISDLRVNVAFKCNAGELEVSI